MSDSVTGLGKSVTAVKYFLAGLMSPSPYYPVPPASAQELACSEEAILCCVVPQQGVVHAPRLVLDVLHDVVESVGVPVQGVFVRKVV